MNHFQAFRAMFLAITCLLGGILLIYKGLLSLSALTSVKSKIHNLNVDFRTDNNGHNTYSIVFDIDTLNSRGGIAMGSDFTAKEEDFYLSLDSTALYTITVDPTSNSNSEGVYFGIKSISLKNKKLYETSKFSLIIIGVCLFLLSLAIFYFRFYKRQ